MKNIGDKLVLTAFLVIICLLWPIWFFAQKYADTTNYENRVLAEKPELTLETYEDFPDEYTSWLNDHLPFRNYLITMNSAVDYFVFNSSSNPMVIKGKGDWLFFNADDADNGNPIADYQGTNLMSDEELQKVAENCIKQRDILKSQGKDFIIFIAPNKERVYSEYMADEYGKPSPEYKALQIYNYLKENTDIKVVYPYEEIMEAKEKAGVNIYYKKDTHWNHIGAYIGARALLDELGINIPGLDDEGISIAKGDGYMGDLSKMLNLVKQLKNNDSEYAVSGYDDHNVEGIENDEEITLYRASNADKRRVYIIRDSFGIYLSPVVASQFDQTYAIYYKAYTYESLKEQNPDVVIYETVERKLDTLGEFSVERAEKAKQP